jgi:hypothetical protein
MEMADCILIVSTKYVDNLSVLASDKDKGKLVHKCKNMLNNMNMITSWHVQIICFLSSRKQVLCV